MACAMTARRNLDTERFFAHYATMQRIRAFERAALRASREGLATGAIHASIGQEAVASGICGNLDRPDLLLSNHRGHGHTLAKGADPGAMMRELLGREGGVCGGKGGSMHIADFGVGMLGANGVVGANILIAAGAAHGIKLRRSRTGDERVVVCIFGDGAVNRGPFLEGLNWAAVYRLPVLFVCEDNGFAATTRTEALTAGPGPKARAESLGLAAAEVDGNDIVAVDAVARDFIAAARAGEPRFILAKTWRLEGHTAADQGSYREASEVEARWANDPMARCEALLDHAGVEAQRLQGARDAAIGEMEAAFEEARAADWPLASTAFEDVLDTTAPGTKAKFGAGARVQSGSRMGAAAKAGEGAAG